MHHPHSKTTAGHVAFKLSGSLCLLLATSFFASTAGAQTTGYSFNVVSGNWGTSTNWNPVGVPDNITNTTVFVGSGKTATVDGAFSTGFLGVGSSGTVNISGSGNSLSLANLGSSTTGLQLQGGGQLTLTSGTSLSVTGNTIIGSGTAASVIHPRLSVTNASVTLSNLQFTGSGGNVQAEVVLNEGASLAINAISTGNTTANTLVFNGGASGFGQLAATAFDAGKMGNLSITSGSYAGTGVFTLIDAGTWVSSFSGILFNSQSYTLGSDVVVSDNTWKIFQSGNDLMLSVTSNIPEPGTAGLLAALAAFGGTMSSRRRHRIA